MMYQYNFIIHNQINNYQNATASPKKIYKSQKINNILSTNMTKVICKDVKIGIPQGCVLDLILFLIFTNAIAQSVNDVSCNIFADDATLYAIANM